MRLSCISLFGGWLPHCARRSSKSAADDVAEYVVQFANASLQGLRFSLAENGVQRVPINMLPTEFAAK